METVRRRNFRDGFKTNLSPLEKVYDCDIADVRTLARLRCQPDQRSKRRTWPQMFGLKDTVIPHKSLNALYTYC